MREKGWFLAVAAVLCLAIPAQAGQFKIGYVCNNFNDTFQTFIIDAARAYAAANAGAVHLEVTDAQDDVVRQKDLVDTFIKSGVQALVVVPVNTSACGPIVKAAANARIPLVFVNRDPFAKRAIPPNVYYIGADSALEGESQMQAAGKALDGKGNIVILMGQLTNEATYARTNGVKSVIKAKYPGVKILAEQTGNWQRNQGASIMENWISAYGMEINAVLSNNDEMALGAILALQKAGIPDVLVFGVDAIPDALAAIAKGDMAGTILQDPVGQGRGAVEMAVNILNGDKPEKRVVKLPAQLINRDNVAKFRK